MEIFGIGGGELLAILIIMLVVAGPKRMVRWAYVLGQYTAKLRGMWAETMAYVEKEFREAGMDVTLPRDIPTRGTLNQQIGQQLEKAMAPITKPVQETLNEAANQVSMIKDKATISDTNGFSPKPASNGSSSDLGTWSENKPEE
jgi:Sec-independent protein translocase protein TatA